MSSPKSLRLVFPIYTVFGPCPSTVKYEAKFTNLQFLMRQVWQLYFFGGRKEELKMKIKNLSKAWSNDDSKKAIDKHAVQLKKKQMLRQGLMTNHKRITLVMLPGQQGTCVGDHFIHHSLCRCDQFKNAILDHSN